MPLDRTKLNHLSTYARLCEQLTTAAVTAYDAEKPKATEDTVRTVQDLLENMKETITELLTP